MEVMDEPVVDGTCLTMCPEDEIALRIREGLVHMLETSSVHLELNGKSRRSVADASKMVKEFSRPAAGRADTESHNLRPVPVLKQTVAYLYKDIVASDHPAWSTIYEFVFDRLRAVRQDMVIQGIVGQDAIQLLEQVVRFHLYASYRLRDASVADFDPVINKQHLLECLKRLLYLYQVTPGHHEHRVEMESVYLLDNLGDHHAMTHYLDLDQSLRKSPLLLQCYKISSAYVQANYLRVLRLLWQLPCAMSLCAVNQHIYKVQIHFLEILSFGFNAKSCKFPVNLLTTVLHMDSDKRTEELCSHCSLIDMFENLSPEYICFNKTNFRKPHPLKQPAAGLLILDKLLYKCSIPELLLGINKKSMFEDTGNEEWIQIQEKNVNAVKPQGSLLITTKDHLDKGDMEELTYLKNIMQGVTLQDNKTPNTGLKRYRGRGRGRQE
ncbi:unnamed protein product [Lymnaea stagnalis]|uniref:SAC3/GANP/THP3 conserved domain-containing protein n=1 Tax=Lymnaea stagnalis TaxID=6523 RepID=A0AAV2HF73_LYMST